MCRYWDTIKHIAQVYILYIRPTYKFLSYRRQAFVVWSRLRIVTAINCHVWLRHWILLTVEGFAWLEQRTILLSWKSSSNPNKDKSLYPLKLLDEISYLLPNFNGTAGKAWERIANSIHPTRYWAFDYLFMLGLKLIHVDKRGPDHSNVRGNSTGFRCVFYSMIYLHSVK